MRRRARIIHGGSGRASRLDREIGDALRGDDRSGESGSVLVEVTRTRRGGEYVWGIPGGEYSHDESRIRRAAQKIVDEMRAAGVPAHVEVRVAADPHGGW